MTSYITSVGVQHFSITIASGNLTGTATVTATGSGAFILFGGYNCSVSNDPAESKAYLTLTNSTTITATRNTSTTGSITITGCIVDGDTTNLIKSVQYGTITIATASTSGTASITAVTNAQSLQTLNETMSGLAKTQSDTMQMIALIGKSQQAPKEVTLDNGRKATIKPMAMQ